MPSRLVSLLIVFSLTVPAAAPVSADRRAAGHGGDAAGLLPPDACEALLAEYAAALEEARTCKAHVRHPQCTLMVPASPGDLCGCRVPVNPLNGRALGRLEQVRMAYIEGGCPMDTQCTGTACAAASQCVANVMGNPPGQPGGTCEPGF